MLLASFSLTTLALFLSSPPPFATRQQRHTIISRHMTKENNDNDSASGDNGLKLTWETKVAETIRTKMKEQETTTTSAANNNNKPPFMVSVSGIPGSGKTTSCRILEGLLEDLGCIVVPFDGYHYPMAALEAFLDAKDAIYRRGAPDTFDAESLRADLERIRCGKETTIEIPGFDHARGDPEPGAHEFRREIHRLVLCEGLYLLHDEDGWESIADFFDWKIFVDAGVDACIERLKIRNKVIPGYTEEEIEKRCDDVDRSNALTVERSRVNADLIVTSAAT